MRIIRGKFGGRKLLEFEKIGVRPTSDMLRESLFNIIGDDVEDCAFLDLYSGTGAVGIEAKSRGAKTVYLNDSSKESIALIKKNLSSIGADGECNVSSSDAISFLSNTTQKFDYVYIDPPYDSGLGEQSIIKSLNVLNDNGVIIYEDQKDVDYDLEELALLDKRRYGRAYLYFFCRKKSACVFAGTFDPLTTGHVHLIEKCLNFYKKVVLVLGENSDKTPMFSEEIRLEFLTKTFFENKRVEIVKYSEHRQDFYQLLKAKGVSYYVRGIRDDIDKSYENLYKQNNAQVYPDIQTVHIKADKEYKKISSTLVRENIKNGKNIKGLVPKQVLKIINDLQKD